ncbi:uncharacterized protein LOC123225889 isoform X2 [Mangifera indica]|uniref:uncharacterized protein LOC123225889 isoform X2 n=1 Tax=Mangifera indica TaxID=29780 RepID=UPI001CFB6E70|nr:uncharacterized protein LOC123225889 isoform X2 [Mangifera indica]
MAIAGIHNVPVLDSSFLRESQSQTSTSRGGEESRSTQPSSLLQMWRELEDEHVVSHPQERVNERLLEQGGDRLTADFARTDMSESLGGEHGGGLGDASVSENEFSQWSPIRFGTQNGHEDPSNLNYDRTSGLGEVERERVRQIFREWMNTGARECTNISHMSHSPRAEWLGETEQERVRIIREWVQLNSQQRGACADIREEHTTDMGGQIEQVLDGLVVNQNGQTEHVRNRRGIRRLCGRQALLDMIKNAEIERQRELHGLLEHRAVSNFAHRGRIQSLLRGRFLRNDQMVEDERPRSTAARELGLLRQKHTVSGLREGFISRLSSCHSDISSNADISGNRNEHSQTNNSQEVMDVFHEPSELNNDENASHSLSDGRTDIGGDIIGNISLQESSARVEQWQEQVSENEITEWQRSANAEIIERRCNSGQGLNEDWQGNTANELSQEPPHNEDAVNFQLQETGELSHQQSSEESATHGSTHAADNLEGNLIQDVVGQEPAAILEHWQEQVFGNEERVFDWHGTSLQSDEWRDGDGDVIENQQEIAANLWTQDGEHGHLQDGFQEAVRDWLERPAESETYSVGRVDTFYLPDDDNVYSMELRELLSRQSRAPIDWEMHGTSTAAAASAEQDLEQQSGEQTEGQDDAVESPPLAIPSPPIPPVQPLWGHVSHHDNWPAHDMHQRFGIEWEIINDLRIDMARLQQRMNNMQRMLEACMDMQLELQRSIRQEVSAALNRSAGSPGICEDDMLEDGSKWDYVRKGVCCICCDSNIDSLLYRCGHMCSCSKCANELVQNGGKCPMCRAPVVEVIRAYSIL